MTALACSALCGTSRAIDWAGQARRRGAWNPFSIAAPARRSESAQPAFPRQAVIAAVPPLNPRHGLGLGGALHLPLQVTRSVMFPPRWPPSRTRWSPWSWGAPAGLDKAGWSSRESLRVNAHSAISTAAPRPVAEFLLISRRVRCSVPCRGWNSPVKPVIVRAGVWGTEVDRPGTFVSSHPQVVCRTLTDAPCPPRVIPHCAPWSP